MRKLLILCLSVTPFFTFGQKKWSLDECIDYAEKNNLSVKNAQISSQIYNENIVINKKQNIPNLGLYVSNQYQFVRENDPATLKYIKTNTSNSTNMGINASAELFSGLRKYYNVKKSLADFELSKTDAQTVKNNTSLSVIQAYMTILLQKELVSSAQKQINISDINIEKAQSQYKSGVITEEKLQSMLAQKDQETYALASAKGSLQSAIIDMCTLLNISDYETFDVQEIELNLLDDKVNNSAFQSVVDKLPEVKAEQQKMDLEQFNVSLAKSTLYPTLSLNASYGTSFNSSKKVPLIDSNGNYVLYGNQPAVTDYSIKDQIVNNQMGYIGLSLNIPILSFYHVKNSINVSKYRTEIAKNQLENVKKQQIDKLQKLNIETEVAIEKYKIAVSNVEKNEIVLFHINEKFKNGIISISDYNLAKENVLIAQAKVSSAKYEYLLKKKIIDFYINNKNE